MSPSNGLIDAPEGFEVVKVCAECSEAVEEWDDALYECGECGNRFPRSDHDSSRCEDCNKFAAKVGQAHDGCEGVEEDATEQLRCLNCEELFETTEEAEAHAKEEAEDEAEADEERDEGLAAMKVVQTRYISLFKDSRYIVEDEARPTNTVIIELNQRGKVGIDDSIPCFFASMATAGGRLVTETTPTSRRYGHKVGEAVPAFGISHQYIAKRAVQNDDGTVTLSQQLSAAQIARGEVPREWRARPLPPAEYAEAVQKWALRAAKEVQQ